MYVHTAVWPSRCVVSNVCLSVPPLPFISFFRSLCVCHVSCLLSDQDRISDFELKLMDIDSEHLGIPKTEYNCTIQVSERISAWRQDKEIKSKQRRQVGRSYHHHYYNTVHLPPCVPPRESLASEIVNGMCLFCGGSEYSTGDPSAQMPLLSHNTSTLSLPVLLYCMGSPFASRVSERPSALYPELV